jgi:hypothetical protein
MPLRYVMQSVLVKVLAFDYLLILKPVTLRA